MCTLAISNSINTTCVVAWLLGDSMDILFGLPHDETVKEDRVEMNAVRKPAYDCRHRKYSPHDIDAISSGADLPKPIANAGY